MSLPQDPSLLIDASSLSVEIGILSHRQWLERESISGNALENLFDALKVLLKRTHLRFEDIKTFIYCEGPGSLLGLRLSAMALNTWSQLYEKPIYTYQALELTALALAQKESSATLLAPFRSNSFCHVNIDAHKGNSELEIIPQNDLEKLEMPIFYLIQRKRQTALPRPHQCIPYSIENLPSFLGNIHLKQSQGLVDVYMPEETEFVTWNAQRHRGR